MIFLLSTAALALDHFFAESKNKLPRHLLEKPARWVKQYFFNGTRQQGLFALAFLLLPIILGSILLHLIFGWLFDVLAMYLAINLRQTTLLASQVFDDLNKGRLLSAQMAVSHMTEQDAVTLTQQNIINCTIENTLKRGNDTVFAVLFWYLAAGVPGLLLYRSTTLLNKLWTEADKQNLNFNYYSQQLTTLLNWIPARLCALSYAFMGNTAIAFHCWQQQAQILGRANTPSIIAAGAGALNIKLGRKQKKTSYGEGKEAQLDDITRSIELVYKTVAFFLVLIFIRETILT